MAVRIIKPGSKQSEKIHEFSFLGAAEESQEDLYSQLPWVESPPGESGPTPKKVSQAPDPAVPAVDTAQIEKNAFENGFRQGEKAGAEAADKKLDATRRRYAEAIVELGRVKSALHVQVEREAVKLSLEIAKKIVHREVQADREIIQTLVRVALSHVAEKTPVTIHLHPTDYSFILERKTELSQGDQSGREISLIADKSIERGGCLVKTECGDVDARIEEEFREIERGFFDGAS